MLKVFIVLCFLLSSNVVHAKENIPNITYQIVKLKSSWVLRIDTYYGYFNMYKGNGFYYYFKGSYRTLNFIGIKLFTKNKRFLDFLESFKYIKKVWFTIKKTLDTWDCLHLIRYGYLFSIEKSVAVALVKLYNKITRKRTKIPDIIFIMNNSYRIRCIVP